MRGIEVLQEASVTGRNGQLMLMQKVVNREGTPLHHGGYWREYY